MRFLNSLKVPKATELGRKCKIQTNKPPVGNKRSIATAVSRSADPNSVRVLEFPEQLVESIRRLFCKACRENIAIKRSDVQNHVKSKKHSDSKGET